jgi:hypothetical protein
VAPLLKGSLAVPPPLPQVQVLVRVRVLLVVVVVAVVVDLPQLAIDHRPSRLNTRVRRSKLSLILVLLGVLLHQWSRLGMRHLQSLWHLWMVLASTERCLDCCPRRR